jgi:predicted secreted protein
VLSLSKSLRTVCQQAGEEERRMELVKIVRELKQERDRLDRAIAALEGSNSRTSISARSSMASAKTAAVRPMRHGLTPAGRKRLSELMKKRWKEGRFKKA